MGSLRQMVLVPAGQLIDHRASEPQQHRLSQLDNEMERILNTTHLSDDEKSKKYLAALHSYLRLNTALTDQLARPLPVRLDSPPAIPEVPSPPDPPGPSFVTPEKKKKRTASVKKKVKRLSKSNERWMRY